MATITLPHTSPTTLAHIAANYKAVQTSFRGAFMDGGNLAGTAGIAHYHVAPGAVTSGNISGIAANRLRRQLVTSRLILDGTLANDRVNWGKVYVARNPTAGRHQFHGKITATLANGTSGGTLEALHADATDGTPKETVATPLRCRWSIQPTNSAQIVPPCTEQLVAFTLNTLSTTTFKLDWETAIASNLTADWPIIVHYWVWSA